MLSSGGRNQRAGKRDRFYHRFDPTQMFLKSEPVFSGLKVKGVRASICPSVIASTSEPPPTSPPTHP